MKKKTIIFVSLLAVFLMIMIPNINAVEYNSVKENVESRINSIHKDYDDQILKNSLIQLIKIIDLKKSFNFIYAIVLLITSIFSAVMTIYSVFMVYSSFVDYNNLYLALLWILNVILWTLDTILYFNGFLDELKNPTIC